MNETQCEIIYVCVCVCVNPPTKNKLKNNIIYDGDIYVNIKYEKKNKTKKKNRQDIQTMYLFIYE